MDNRSNKRPADNASNDTASPKRQRTTETTNGYPHNIDTSAAVPPPTSTSTSNQSPLSPNGPVSPAATPAEVAADFKEALEDITTDKTQITLLTKIAQEAIEHALVISEVLEKHISKTPPHRKLAAFYVLDSIVKNVGTPYTIYLSQNLYRTFMDAYQVVDLGVRKALEGMAKTWKEPVPGSGEVRPIFPVETVKRIENALLQHRTLVLNQHRQQQLEQARTQQRQVHALPPRPTVTATPQPWGSTAPQISAQTPQTPAQTPQVPAQYAPPPVQQQQPGERHLAATPDIHYGNSTSGYINVNGAPSGNFQAPTSAIPQHYQSQYGLPQYPTQQQQPSPQTHQPYQQPYQQQHPALQHLQYHLPPPPPAIRAPTPPLVQYQNYTPIPVSQGAGPFRPPTPHAPFRPPTPHAPQQHVAPTPTPQATPQAAPSSFQFPGLEALFRQQPRTPDLHTQPYNFPPTPAPQPTPTPSGLFATFAPFAMSTPPMAAANMVQSASANIAPPAVVPAVVPTVINDAQLTAESIKIARPALINAMFFQPGSTLCTSCGRRFLGTPEGKAQKAAHLDAHFRSNATMNAMADTARPVSRNWFLSEMEWIRNREIDDALPGEGGGAAMTRTRSSASATSEGRKEKEKEVYVKAPADAAVVKRACPICQEDFEAIWSKEAQEWVWMGVVEAGGKAYHKSCLDELQKDGLGKGIKEKLQ